MRRIVLFGATGYTGRLVAEALMRARARPVLAGRSGQNLAALGVLLGKGLETAVADAADPDSLLSLIRPDDVVVSTAGPFARIGRPVIEAVIERRATYIDSAGEPSFLRSVFETFGPAAEEAEVALVPGAAFEFVAGNLAAWMALTGTTPHATRIDIGYFLTGGLRQAASAGTKASVGGALVELSFAWRDGALVTVPPGDRIQGFDVGARSRPALAYGGTEHFNIPRMFPYVREVGVYFGGPVSARAMRIAQRFAGRAYRVKGVPPAVRWLMSLPRNKEGPDAAERAKVRSVVTATSYDEDGRELRTVTLSGANPYSFTGDFLAWAAMRAATVGIDGMGALGPLEAFTPAQLRAGVKSAGLDLVS